MRVGVLRGETRGVQLQQLANPMRIRSCLFRQTISSCTFSVAKDTQMELLNPQGYSTSFVCSISLLHVTLH